MKVHTYNAIQIFPKAEQLARFEKVCMAYQQIYQRLFSQVRFLILASKPVEYTALIRSLKHEDEALDLELFAKYPELVKGATLKVKSVFAPIRNYMDCHTMAPYLERERVAQSFALPILSSDNQGIELPHIGMLSKDGKTKQALYIEFVRSAQVSRQWHAKAIIETEIRPSATGAAIMAMTPVREKPIAFYSTEQKAVDPIGIADYARVVDLKSKSAGSAVKRMRDATEALDHDFRQAARDYDLRAYELEQRAYAYAPIFAKQIVESFAAIGFCEPVTPGMKIGWDFLNLDILMNEVQRLLLIGTVEHKQMKNPINVFTNMAYCPHCGNASHSKIDGTDVVCGKRGHDRLSIYDAIANNTLAALKNKL